MVVGVVVGVVVVVEEAGGAVETERGGWEVGGAGGREGEKQMRKPTNLSSLKKVQKFIQR